MARVNVVVVKTVVFFVLFGGMLLGFTTNASANPAGCTGTGHASCEYDTITPCRDGNVPTCFGVIDQDYSGHFNNECLNCDTSSDCHLISGSWETAECTEGCFDKDGHIVDGDTYPVGRVVWSTIGAKCN
jgi:hypothetical protein